MKHPNDTMGSLAELAKDYSNTIAEQKLIIADQQKAYEKLALEYEALENKYEKLRSKKEKDIW